MSDAGVGTQNDFEGINADLGFGTSIEDDFAGITADINSGAGPRDPFAGVPPADSGGQKKVIPPVEDKPAKVAEKKEGVKRKARKRSLLGEEDTTVYRRSILGS